MPPLAIPFKLRAKLSKEKQYGYGLVPDFWTAELTQRASGLPAHYHHPVFIEAATRSEAAAIARAEFAKRDIQVVIR